MFALKLKFGLANPLMRVWLGRWSGEEETLERWVN
jgi:uncharacterized membrane protein YjgN (DUF898 family)